MKKIILVSFASLLIGGGVYSQQTNTAIKNDKKEIPNEVKDKKLPKTKKEREPEIKSDKLQVDSVKNNVDTTRG